MRQTGYIGKPRLYNRLLTLLTKHPEGMIPYDIHKTIKTNDRTIRKYLKQLVIAGKITTIPTWKKGMERYILIPETIVDINQFRKDKSEKIIEQYFGGFWYGNINYFDTPQYCEKWTEDLRERARAYRGYKCFECGTPQNGRKLNVHHVHYNKKTCCDGSPHDLVPLCLPCHTRTNGNRDFWESHFTEMIYSIDPRGKCFFTKEEMETYKQKPQ
jgi:hypothetical protein